MAIRYSKNWYFPFLLELHNIWVFVPDSTNIQSRLQILSRIPRTFPGRFPFWSGRLSLRFCSKNKSTAGLLGLSQFHFHQSPVSQERFGVARVGLHGQRSASVTYSHTVLHPNSAIPYFVLLPPPGTRTKGWILGGVHKDR